MSKLLRQQKIIKKFEENDEGKSTFSRHHEDLMIRGRKKDREISKGKKVLIFLHFILLL